MKDITIENNGKHTDPFVVPEGYFDDIAKRVIERIEQEAEQEAIKRHRSVVSIVRRWSAAACIVFAVGFGLWQYNTNTWDETPDDSDNIYFFADNLNADAWDAAMDYVMIDNMDIACYLTETY